MTGSKKAIDIDMFGTEVEEDLLIEEGVTTRSSRGGAYIIVYNDDENTFEWVIECFIEVLDHTFEQAEQCSLLIHFKGKAVVKRGSREELMPMKDALTERGLSAVLEEDKDDDDD